MRLNRIPAALLAVSLLAAPARATEQASYVTPTAGPMSMATFTATYLNPALRALASCHWGTVAPANGPSSTPLPYQCWADTTSNPVLFKHYDGASWVIVGSLNTSTHAWLPYLTGGVSGGVPFFSATNIMGTSALWTNHALAVGGGAGTAPRTIAAMTDGQLPIGQTGADPSPTSLTGDVTVTAGGVTAIGTNKVANSQLRQSGALTLIGRSANTTGNVADIAASAASDCVYRESSSTIGCGTVATAGIANSAVTNAKLRQGVARSVIGVTGNSTGDVSDIQGSTDQVLRINGAGTVLAFGAIDLSKSAATTGVLQATSFPALTGDVTTVSGALATTIAANAVTDAKLRQGGALTLIGRSANTTGNVADIAASAASDCVYRESSSTIGCGTVATAGIANSAVTNAKLANAAAYTFKGNATSGSAAPTDFTIAGLAHKASPATTDLLILSDEAASHAIKYASIAEVIGALASGVTSIASNTGAFTLNAPSGITNSTNDIILQQASASQFGAVKVDNSTITAASGVISVPTTPTSWTPVLTAATVGNLSVSYTTQSGNYVKIGKLVIATFNLQTSAFTYTTAGGSIQITGLPFAANSTASIQFTGPLRIGGWTHAGYSQANCGLAAGAQLLTVEVAGSGVGAGSEAITSFPTAGTVVLRGEITYYTD